VRLLYERDWTRQRILDFFSVLDWMMRLPKELEQRLWQDIENIEGERKVKYVTSVERLAIERGLQKGMEEGLEKGLEQGLEKGRAQGTASVLLRLLNRRFGPLSADVTRRLAQSTPEQLEIWAERVLDAGTIDEVFAEN
jgi:predicted transposase YdaD